MTLEDEARTHCLLVAGGSDWHGATRQALRSWYVTKYHMGVRLDRMEVAAMLGKPWVFSSVGWSSVPPSMPQSQTVEKRPPIDVLA